MRNYLYDMPLVTSAVTTRVKRGLCHANRKSDTILFGGVWFLQRMIPIAIIFV